MLADYLDGYEEFLDEHDRRALGLAPMQIAPQTQRANLTQRQPFVLSPGAPTQQAVLTPRQTFVPAPAQYAAPPAAPPGVGPYVPADPVRLRAALVPAGRVLAVPFAQSGATLLNPGTPITSSPASMPMTPMTASVPTSGDVPMIIPDQTGSTPAGTTPQYLSTQQAQWTQPPAAGASSSGTSGISTSTFGWLALLAGAWWMWRSVKD